MALQYLNLDEQKDSALIQHLNLGDKGADTIIIHPGSHSIKFGLASQSSPFIVPNLIAYPTKKGQKIESYEEEKGIEENIQDAFD